MTAMLASVSSLDEAMLVLAAGVDLIDLKQPASGALGALAPELCQEIVKRINGSCPVSATIGDLPMHAETIGRAARSMAATGVDFIKIGFFPGGNRDACIRELAGMIRSGQQLIAVLFADADPDFTIIEILAAQGFAGVMLDTADKHNGGLLRVMPGKQIQGFINRAQDNELLCGLAGSLSLADIPELMTLQPDYLGFRGALCTDQLRTKTLDSGAVTRIKQALTPNLAADYS